MKIRTTKNETLGIFTGVDVGESNGSSPIPQVLMV